MKTEEEMRADFEASIVETTGQSLEYHKKYKKYAIRLAWKCWKKATMLERTRCVKIMRSAIEDLQEVKLPHED